MSNTDLDAAWLALDGAGSGPGEIRLAGLDTVNDIGQLLVGRDSQRHLHLLVPVPLGQAVTADRRSKRVTIERSEYVVGADRRPFADVACLDPELDDVFRRLTAEMVDGIAAEPGESVAVCRRVLSRWRAMLEQSRQPLGGEAIAGLFGELWTLTRFVSRDPERRLGAWAGPKGAVHDFLTPAIAVEVKTTTKREGRAVEIHGIEQLAEPSGRRLYLFFVRLRPDASGRSVGDLVAALKKTGVDGYELDGHLAVMGWEPTPEEERFVVVEEVLYEVGAGFPRIVPQSFAAGALPSGVLRLRYDVDLTGPVPAPLDRPGTDGVFDALAGWV